ncbi:alpha/beta hydrolase [Halorussus gelatinilyticus]|uniref:Alpha/beta hydrolase n=1 Tax=Halorussus gelatinilyticus TaxID=2937524 RepID=A0A8U0IG89_9EURY|nr:alpha/beta fold hydrolase [Halorussus gelatinilyticus]UPV99685.1 alpha/beta hydrolase [Halorussus gelatinilyticus]
MGRERGLLRGSEGRYPYVTFGSGPRTLVVFAGLSDAFQPERPARYLGLLLERYYYRLFADEFTVYVVGRRRNLPAGTTTREMAAEYADLLDAHDIAPADVLGVSLGGLVAQYLAADAPDLVDRLVLGVSGHRVGEAGRRTLRRWAEWADRGWWFDAYIDSIPVTYTGYRRWLYPPLIRTVGRLLLSEPAAVSDVAVSCRACLDHDATDRLGDVDAPTLVVGGTEDHFFPPEILRETAAAVPDARLELVDGTGHGAFEERKRAFDRTVKAFLTA